MGELIRTARNPQKQEVLLYDTWSCPVLCFMEDVDEVLDWMRNLDGRFKQVYYPGEEYIRIVKVVN